jgi:hypothetical protein
MLKNVFFILMLALVSFAIMPQSAQAGPILSQEFLIDDPSGPIFIGSISIDLDDIVAGEVLEWQVFNLFGFDMGTSFGVFADYDPFNLGAGFSFLNFDVNDMSDTFAFNGFWDINFAPGFLDIFTTAGDFILAESLIMGQVSLVSEPATGLLFLLAAAGFLVRRRRL